MPAIIRFFLVVSAVAPAACSSDSEDLFAGACPTDSVALPDGGCQSPVAPGSGGATAGGAGGQVVATGGASGRSGTTGGAAGGLGTGGLGAGGADGGSSGGGTDGGSLAMCPVTGGGVSLTPLGSCTVLAYCDRNEFRLVCRDGAPTCDCRTKGVTLKTIPNDRDYCAPSSTGTRANIDAANASCGWDLDTSGFHN